MSTRIVIADDHPIFRDGLKRLLESEKEFKVVGEACDGVEAVKLARQLKPEILLLDLAMPRRPGLEALREMNSDSSSVRVILLTAAVVFLVLVFALKHRAERFRHPNPAEEHPRSDERRVLGWTRERVKSGPISAKPR